MPPLPPHLYREREIRRRLIVALDVGDENAALRLAEALRPELSFVKVGLQLFAAAGPDVVRKMVSLGLRVFLDLKLHDIPNTVAGGVRSLAQLGVHFTTVHASALRAVGEAVRAAQAEAPHGPSDLPVGILAVTVLTSYDEGELTGAFASPLSTTQLVQRLGRAAVEQGACGLVASPLEIESLREALGPDPVLVIPGIRPAGADAADQRRVASPAAAVAAGADFLVVGRPITRAASPADAMRRILDEMEGAG